MQWINLSQYIRLNTIFWEVFTFISIEILSLLLYAEASKNYILTLLRINLY
jgi:hypothetical protein